MNKYYRFEGDANNANMEYFMMPDESIIWRGTPNKKAYVINSSVKMAPIALIWLLFDGFFIGTFLFGGAAGSMGGTAFLLIPFFALHLMPVWIWLSNMLTASKRWKNTQYVITNKRILLRNGLIGYEFKSILFTDISNVNIRVGVIDKMLHVGDIYITTYGCDHHGGGHAAAILDVERPDYVFGVLQQTIMGER